MYGDATRPETLEAAGLATAGSLILPSVGMANSTEVIWTLQPLIRHVRVLGAGAVPGHVAALTYAGAHAVHSREGEVALAFIEDILETPGATAEQIDRERARAHRELAGEARSPAPLPGPRGADPARFRVVGLAWAAGRSTRFCGKLSACTHSARLAQR